MEPDTEDTHMATFAVSASDDTVKSLSEIMDNLAHDGEKKADTLLQIPLLH